jgi:hypothetical protein
MGKGAYAARLIEASCIVAAGQLLAVHKMVGGSIGKVGKAYSVNLKIIDVSTGTIERQVSDDFKCSGDRRPLQNRENRGNCLRGRYGYRTQGHETEPRHGSIFRKSAFPAWK